MQNLTANIETYTSVTTHTTYNVLAYTDDGSGDSIIVVRMYVMLFMICTLNCIKYLALFPGLPQLQFLIVCSVDHVVRFTRSSPPSVFAYCKQSKTGAGEGLQMKLLDTHQPWS